MDRPTESPLRNTRNSWEVTPADRTPGLGAMLRIGARAVRVTEVRGLVGTAEHESDRKPAFVTMVVFGLVALVFLWGVFDIGWRVKFLVGAVVFTAIAMTALNDMTWLSTAGIYRVEILLANGETLRYATIDPADQQKLLTAVGRLMVRPPANDVDPALPANSASSSWRA